MYKYRVVEQDGNQGLCKLQCSNGRFHSVRMLGPLPALRLRLVGDKPHLGFGILKCPSSGAFFRVIFEAINSPPDPTPTVLQTPAVANSMTSAAGMGAAD